MDHRNKLLALANLKNGKSPTETSECVGISYAQAMKLKKELVAAEEDGTEEELFDMTSDGIEILINSTVNTVIPPLEEFGIATALEQGVTELITRESTLEQELKIAATAITKKIGSIAVTASNVDTINALTKALCDLQAAFYGSEGSTGGTGSFEQFLED